MKRIYRALALIIAISICSCSLEQNIINSTSTPESTSTFTIEPSTTKTMTVEPSKTPLLPLSPTAFQNLYVVAGATLEQAKVMDKAILDFVDAVKKEDKELVAGMMIYPTWLIIEDEPTKVMNNDEFIKYYDFVFTENFKNSLRKLQLNNEYIFSSWRGICLLHSDEMGYFQIWLSSDYDGKITSIDFIDFTKSEPVTAIPTYTSVSTKTSQIPEASTTQVTPTLTPYRFTLTAQNEKSFSTYYGLWIITRYEFLGNTAFVTNEFADSQIGKKIELLENEINVDYDFLWLSKTSYKNVSYDWADESDFVGSGWQALLPNDNPDKHKGLLFLDFYYNDGYPLSGMEVSKSGRLVIYYDGYWFFLDKVMEP